MRKLDGGSSPRLGCTYSRVSNPNDERTASLDTQEEAEIKLLESRGFIVPTECRFREQYTAMESIHDRPVLERVRDLIASGRVKAIACYDTDRLARDPQDLTTIVRDCHDRGAEVLFCRMDHETKDRVGQFILYAKGFASALEWDATRDRTHRGRMDLWNKGLWVGNGTVRYGYTWDKSSRTRKAHPEHARVVVRVFESIAKGDSSYQVAESLNAEGIAGPRGRGWAPSQVRAMVRCETYKGIVVARKTMQSDKRRPSGGRAQVPRPEDQRIVLGNHGTDTIVSELLWDQANSKLSSGAIRKSGPRRKGAVHWLSGYIRCACGERVVGNTIKPPHRSNPWRCYRCFKGCGKTYAATWVEEQAWELMKRKLLEPDYLESKLKQFGTEGRLESECARLSKRLEKLRGVANKLVNSLAESKSDLVTASLRNKLAQLDGEVQVTSGYLRDLESQVALARSDALGRGDFLSSVTAFRAAIQFDVLDAAILAHQKRSFLESMGCLEFHVKNENGEREVRLLVNPAASTDRRRRIDKTLLLL